VGAVKAKDADTKAATKQTLTYSIVSQKDASNVDVTHFAIDPVKGGITVPTAGAINFEASPSYTLVVRVTDNGSPATFTEQTITVNVTDVNEAATFAVFNASNDPVAPFTLTVTKATADNDQKIGRLTYADVDAGVAGTYTASLIKAAVESASKGALTWDPVSGDLTIKDKTKLTKSFSLKVTIQDTATKPVKSTVTIAINVV
jgi:protocadherin Fat 1/2/3